ncbi:MAG: hypothetical protein SGI87_12045 [Flavobacteriales bacterium]|nr:hypothetical protein [Flavobacteriales bacterium]
MRKQSLTASLFLFLSCCSVGIFSQTDVAFTEILKTAKTVTDVMVVGADSQYFYVSEYDQDKAPALNLVAYGKADMKERWRKRIPLAVEGSANPKFEKIIHFKSGFLLFSTTYSKTTSQIQAFATMISMSGEMLSRPVLVHYMPSEDKAGIPVFDMRLSPDSSRFLLFFDPPYERRASENVSFKLYSPDLEMLWEKDLVLPYSQDVVQIHNYIIDNQGHLYMMSGRAPEKKSLNSGPPMAQGGRYVLFHYNNAENKVKEYDVSLKEKQVVAASFALRSDGSLVIAGYYGNNYQFMAAGTFQFELNPAGKGIKTASFMPFPAEFVARFAGAGESGTSPTIEDFYLDHIFPRPDGSTLIIGEQYFVEEVSRFDPVTGRQIVEYLHHYDDIIVCLLEPGGRITWSTKVPKQQYTRGGEGNCSYNCYYDHQTLRLIFNDDEANIDRLKSLPQGQAVDWNQSKNSITAVVLVTSDGQLTRKALVSNKDVSTLLAPGLSSQNPFGAGVLGYDAGKSYKFCLLKS